MLIIQGCFYEELNDFLSQDKCKTSFFHRIIHPTTIKDFIESPGRPHTEEDLI